MPCTLAPYPESCFSSLAACLFGALDRNVHAIAPMALGGRYCCAHFTEEETDSETSRSMPKVTQLVNGRGGNKDQFSATSRGCCVASPACQMLAPAVGMRQRIQGCKERHGVQEGLFHHKTISF